MDANRICNKVYRNNFKLQLKDFDLKYMRSEIMPRRAVEMCDVFIVTDEFYFKILKCRVPEMPNGLVLPLSYLEHTVQLIHNWQEQ